MGVFKRLVGISNAFVQLGGALGPALKANSGAIEARNSGDSAFAVLRSADPVASNDVVNLEYFQPNRVLRGTYANRPSASTAAAGALYLCTDIPFEYYSDGVNWNQRYEGVDMPAPPAIGSATLVSNNSSISGNAVGDSLRLISYSPRANCALWPSASLTSGGVWSVTLATKVVALNAQYPEVGVCVSTGTTTSDTAYCFSQWWNNGLPGIHNLSVTCGTQTRSVGVELGGVTFNGTGKIAWFRLLADGTSLHFQYSNDGLWWYDWTTISTPTGCLEGLLGSPVRVETIISH